MVAIVKIISEFEIIKANSFFDVFLNCLKFNK